MTTDYGGDALAEMIDRWLSDDQTIRKGLDVEGPWLIEQLLTRGSRSLREIARQTKLSPTYLSNCHHGHCGISAKAYLKLAKLAAELEAK